MSKIQNNEEQNNKPNFRQYTTDELEVFDKEMQKYLKTIKITIPEGREVVVCDEKQFLIDNGGLNRDGAVILKDDYTTKYSELNDKLEQWRFWVGRLEFIEKKKIEGLEELSQGMKT